MVWSSFQLALPSSARPNALLASGEAPKIVAEELDAPVEDDDLLTPEESADIAEAVKKDGPILYPDLRDATGKRSIVIEHNGTDPAKGWQVYYAYPADRDESCLGTQIARTPDATFRPRNKAAARRRSEIRLLVQEPMKAAAIGNDVSAVPGARSMYCSARA